MKRYEYGDSDKASLKEWLILGVVIFILGLLIAVMVNRVNAAPAPIHKVVKPLTDKDIVGPYSATYQGTLFTFTLWPDKVYTGVFSNVYWQGTWRYQDPYIIIEEWEVGYERQSHTALRWYILSSRDKNNKLIRNDYKCIMGVPDIKKDK